MPGTVSAAAVELGILDVVWVVSFVAVAARGEGECRVAAFHDQRRGVSWPGFWWG